MRIFAVTGVAVLCVPSMPAQQVPVINSVVDSATFGVYISNTEVLPAFEGLITIFGSNLADGIYQSQNFPYPTTLGPVQVFFSSGQVFLDNPGVPAELIFVSPSRIDLLVPPTVPGSYVTVQLNSATKTPPFPFRLTAYSPAIFFMGYDCFIDSRYQDWGKNCGLNPLEGSTTVQTEAQ